MKSLNEIRFIEDHQLEKLTTSEQCIYMFLSRNMAHHTISKNLSESEISEIVESFEESLKEFYIEILSLKNVNVFIKKDYMKEEIIEWFFSQDEYKKVSGKFNLKNQSLKLDSSLGKIFSQINPKIYESDISKIIDGLNDLEESLDKEIDISLVRKDRHFEMVTESRKKEPSKLKRCIDLVSIPLFFAVVLSSSMAQADDNSQKAVDHAARAAMEQPAVKEKIREFTADIEKKGKQIEAMIRESGGEVPAAIVGVGIKVVVDQKIQYKGKSSFVPVNYEVSVGLDESKVKISNEKLFDQKMEGWISGSHSDGSNKVEVGVKYEF